MARIRLLLPEAESAQTLQLPPSATLQQLSTLTREFPAIPQTHALRFIHAGKLLTDLTEIPENAVIHVALTPQSQHVTVEMDGTIMEDSPRSDWVVGFCMGVLMGLIMLILSQDRTMALSQKCRTGVSVGAMINILFGLALIIADR